MPATASLSNLSSFSLHGLTTEDAYQKLDSEIAQLEFRLSSLRTLRNSLSPVSKFPTEILSKIFSDSQDPKGSSFPHDADLKTRFFVSWVSRHWRNTALATPSLWTIISRGSKDSGGNMEFAMAFIQRSRTLSISVNLRDPHYKLVKAFVPQMHRVQHLKLTDAVATKQMDKLLSKPAPLLSSLDLDNVELPEETEMFLEIHPSLCHLSMAQMDFNLPSPLLTSTLTSIDLSQLDDRIDASELVEVLPSLQNLKTLSLFMAFEEDTVVPPDNKIRLPRLQSITMSEEFWETACGFLGCLDVPQATISLTWVTRDDDLGETLDDSLGHLQDYFAASSIPIRQLKVENLGSDLLFSCNQSSDNSQHRYHFRFPHEDFMEQHVGRLIRQVMPLTQLETVVLMDWDDGLTGLADLPNVKTVVVSGMSALGGFPPSFGVSTPNKIPFPAIKTLFICDIRPLLLIYEGLHQALETRFSAGMGLDSLFFIDCGGVTKDGFSKFAQEISVTKGNGLNFA